MSKNYNIPDELGGHLLEIIESMIKAGEKKGLTNKQISLGKRLGDLLTLRELALSVKPYKEHSFNKIAMASFELFEEPLLDTKSPYEGLSLTEKVELIAVKDIERDQRNRILERETKRLSKQIIETITLKGLEYLNGFCYVIDGIEYAVEDLVEMYPTFRDKLGLEKRKLEKIYGEAVQDYHIIPEIIDWNLYLTIRGEVPDNIESSYDRIIEKVYQVAQVSAAEERAKEYLDKHPDAIDKILKGIPPVEDSELPRTPLDIKIISKEAYKRANKRETRQELDLDLVEL